MPNRADLAKIHIAKQELGLDDATYRAILRERFGRDSAADLSDVQAASLIELFREKGWRPVTLRQRSLIHVIWHQLAAMGAIRHADDRALAAFVAHATGKTDLYKLTVHEASRIIEMLKKWLERAETRDHRH
jgi:phage gp16-like protein